ncbi:MAG: PD-(D/E)XK nuclease family protein, partial [Pseudomonadota bacterium]
AFFTKSAVSKAIQSLNVHRRDVLGSRVQELEEERLHSQLISWLEIEKTRPLSFVVEACELQAELKLGPLMLKLRLDRVDRLADGSRLVIDYKTGTLESTKRWFETPLRSTQLPIYAQVEPFADGIAFASLKRGVMGFSGVAENELAPGVTRFPNHPDLAYIQEIDQDAPAHVVFRRFWRGELERIAHEFAQGLIDEGDGASASIYFDSSTLTRRPKR